MGIEFIAPGLGRKLLAEPPRPKRYVLDVSRYGKDGWNALSPMFDHGEGEEKRPVIPVPGMPDRKSRTVEGIWQGLKVFAGPGVDQALVSGTELDMLESGKPRKRKGVPLGHLYEGELLKGVVEARKRIYLPAYDWMVRYCPRAHAKYLELLELARAGNMVYVFDRDANGDLNANKPLAHASILAELVRKELSGSPLPAK